jgi:hypothetical protein
MVMSLTPVGVCQLTFAGTTCQVEVRGRVFKHQTPDPDLDTNLVPVGAVLGENASGIPDPPLTLPFNTRLAPSRIGIVARATGAVVDSSVTNFTFRCVQLNG